MIIYRAMTRSASTVALIDGLIGSGPHCHSHDPIVEFLVTAGELECGLTDALPDGPASTHDRLRVISHRAGLALIESWRGDHRAARSHVHHAVTALAALRCQLLPREISINTPEGYAHYGVFPESYAEAAGRFLDQHQPCGLVVVGIRSIGASLSAVVGAAASLRGCRTSSITVRPHGHPYDRRVTLPSFFVKRLTHHEDAYFAIVDEGPGRSGSSFASVSDALAAIGVPPDRIVLFPSWDADGSSFLNASARQVWRRHARYAANFERTFVDSGKLGHDLTDISAGRWRALAAQPEAAVVPEHERRKFTRIDSECTSLFKFAGLGRYGRRKVIRGRHLAHAGFTPEVHAWSSGFIEQQWTDGRPLTGHTVSESDLETFARYLAFISRDFPTRHGTPITETMEMIDANIAGLNPLSRSAWHTWLAEHRHHFEAPAAQIDGRMLPGEWLRAGGRLFKIDALDHHADHFFPGCQNIAWDVAGTCIEFDLDARQSQRLIERTSTLAGDPGLPLRIPVYRLAYLAFRLAYATTATAMVACVDRDAFAAMANRYRTLLSQPPGRA